MGHYRAMKRGDELIPVQEVREVRIVKEAQAPIDIEALAMALIQAMQASGINISKEQALSQISGNQAMANNIDDYDETSSLAKLAETMIVQRGKNTSNFEDLGKEKITQKDAADVKKTIDLLKNID